MGSWLLAPFRALNAALGIPSPWNGTVTAMLFFFVIPSLVFMCLTALSSFIEERRLSLAKMGGYSTAFIPLVAATHFSKAVVKSVSRFQYVPNALKDPIGIDTADALTAEILQIGGDWQTVLNIIARTGSAVVLFGGFAVTILLVMRFSEKRRPFSFLPLMLLALFYMLVTVGALIGSAWL